MGAVVDAEVEAAEALIRMRLPVDCEGAGAGAGAGVGEAEKAEKAGTAAVEATVATSPVLYTRMAGRVARETDEEALVGAGG